MEIKTGAGTLIPVDVLAEVEEVLKRHGFTASLLAQSFEDRSECWLEIKPVPYSAPLSEREFAEMIKREVFDPVIDKINQITEAALAKEDDWTPKDFDG